MVRNIALSLLMLNIIYAVFYWSDPDKKTSMIQPAMQDGVKLLRLPAETDNFDERQRQMAQAVNNPLLLEASGQEKCLALGPFMTVSTGQAVLERLESYGFAIELRAVDEPTGEYDFRVLIPPAASLEEAFRHLRELKSREIDSYVIAQGKDALGISMGVYSTQIAAEDVQASLLEDGYQTEVKPVSQKNREYWIFSRQLKHLAIEGALVAPITQDFPEAKLAMQVCIKNSDFR